MISKTLRSTVAAGFLSALAQTAGSLPAEAAAPAISVLLELPGRPGKLIEHLDGDAAPAGAKYRIVVTPWQSGPLAVVGSGLAGTGDPAVNAEKVAAGKPIELPSPGDWYSLPMNAGELRITATQGGSRSEHVLFSVATAPWKGVSVEAWPQAATNLSPPSPISFEVSLSESIAEADAFATAIARLSAFDEPVLRGGLGAKIFREAGPGVVLIVAGEGAGSGVVLSAGGDILTNWHVVAGAKSVGVIFKPPAGQRISPSSVYEAKVVKYDQVADLALLRLERLPANLVALKLADQASIEVGTSVHAIGHPHGEYWTYTQGVISQIRPGYHWAGKDNADLTATVLQTQTPINPGNSGGPLLDDNGLVVGINSFRDPSAQGIGFAVSAADVRHFLDAKESRSASRLPQPKAPRAEKKADCAARSSPPFMDPVLDKMVVAIDSACRGFPDYYLVGQKPDGSMEYALFDNVGDKKFDAMILFGAKGGPNLWIFYGRRDGVVTGFGYDYSGKGKLERVVLIKAAQQ